MKIRHTICTNMSESSQVYVEPTRKAVRKSVPKVILKRRANALANKRFREKRKEEMDCMRGAIDKLEHELEDALLYYDRLRHSLEEVRRQSDNVNLMMARDTCTDMQQSKEQDIASCLSVMRDTLADDPLYDTWTHHPPSSTQFRSNTTCSASDDDLFDFIDCEEDNKDRDTQSLWRQLEVNSLRENAVTTLFSTAILKCGSIPPPSVINTSSSSWDIYLDELPDDPYLNCRDIVHHIQQGTFPHCTARQLQYADMQLWNPDSMFISCDEEGSRRSVITGDVVRRCEVLETDGLALIDVDFPAVNEDGFNLFGDQDAHHCHLNAFGVRKISEIQADKILSGNFNVLMGRSESHQLGCQDTVDVYFNVLYAVKSPDRVRWHRTHEDCYSGCCIFNVKEGAHYIRLTKSTIATMVASMQLHITSDTTREALKQSIVKFYLSERGVKRSIARALSTVS